MKNTIKMLISGLFLILIMSGCWNGLPELGGNTGGNVTITVGTGNAERTVYPNDIGINTGVFERIEVEVTKGNASVSFILANGETSKTINLGAGTWNISAKGYLKIGDEVYEAARGESSVTVSSGTTSASVALKTGIFEGAPGIFSYTVGFPQDATAVLDISPMNDLHGYTNPNVGKTVQLSAAQGGSFELSPGYYLLTLSARTSDKMSIWNELVHIYSGLETTLSHTFESADFINSVTLSGSVTGGELDGNWVQKALVIAYSDARYLNRVASVAVDLNKEGALYTGNWSMSVPESLVGKTLYFRLEETIGGLAGIKTFTRNSETVEVAASGNTGIKLFASYAWGQWVSLEMGIDSKDAMSHTIEADGTIKATTTQTVEYNWAKWPLGIWYGYPAENEFRYVYEFEAWTEEGELELYFMYVDYPGGSPEQQYQKSKTFTIDETRRTFTTVSQERINSMADRLINFHVASDEFTGTFYIKMKFIKESWDYTPSDTVDGEPRFTATPVETGILLRANLKDLPEGIDTITFYNRGKGMFGAGFPRDSRGNPVYPDSFEVIYPYVEAGKEYTFSLNWWGINIGEIMHEPVTAIGGRGELGYTNAEGLALVKEGNILKFNKTPILSYNESNKINARYSYEFAVGTSWHDIAADWRYAAEKEGPEDIDLLDTDNLPGWYYPKDFSAIAGKTCFAGAFYTFDYWDEDIYPNYDEDGITGFFRTETVSSTPFIYPSIIPAAFTAEQHEEGVLLKVDMAKIPLSTTAIDFRPKDGGDWGGSHWMDVDQYRDWGWNDDTEEWEERFIIDTAEIVYPFVKAGETYTFVAEYVGTGTSGEATVTANAGLGEFKIANGSDLGVLYNSRTKTVSLSAVPIAPSLSDSPNISEEYWKWTFYKGHNWNDSDWSGAIPSEELTASLVLDNTLRDKLDSWWIEKLSATTAYAVFNYSVMYDGREFNTMPIASPSFTFPHFDPVGEVEIRTAFDTNDRLSLSYWSDVSPGDDLDAYIYNYDWNSSVSFIWYIDGVEQEGYTSSRVYLPTSELDPGMHYGLAVVIMDGVPFAQEFSFRVWN